MALFSDLIPKFCVALDCDFAKQQLQCRFHRTKDAQRSRGPPSKHFRPVVNLDDRAFAGEEFRIWVVGTKHQQQVAVHDCIVIRFGADHADAAHPMRVIVGHDVLTLDRMNERRLETI
jgi:hypothetical protein